MQHNRLISRCCVVQLHYLLHSLMLDRVTLITWNEAFKNPFSTLIYSNLCTSFAVMESHLGLSQKLCWPWSPSTSVICLETSSSRLIHSVLIINYIKPEFCLHTLTFNRVAIWLPTNDIYKTMKYFKQKFIWFHHCH